MKAAVPLAADALTATVTHTPTLPDLWGRALRVHQWPKNLLLLVPVMTAHQWRDWPSLRAALVAVVCFCLTASSHYLVNDILDRESDRAHPHKRNRPLAAGHLSLGAAWTVSVVLLLGAGVLAWLFAAPALSIWLAVYFVVTNLYSFWLKKKIVIDVLVLSSLYTIRIMAGGAAANIEVSEWLLAFSMFLFTSLAFAKRYTELRDRAARNAGEQLLGRAYRTEDQELIRVLGPVSGYLSILVMALYVNGPRNTMLYHRPQALWLLCPLFAYWITRIWMLANRGQLHHDPVVFALLDKNSYWTGILCALVVYAAL